MRRIPILLAIILAGCVTSGDPIVVTAQKTTTSAFYTLDLFVHLEHDNRALADSIPGLHKVAQEVRLHGPQAPRPQDNYIQVVRNLTKIYQVNKSDATKSELVKAMSDLTALVNAASQYIPQLQAGTRNP
jgi:hypothetical protein